MKSCFVPFLAEKKKKKKMLGNEKRRKIRIRVCWLWNLFLSLCEWLRNIFFSASIQETIWIIFFFSNKITSSAHKKSALNTTHVYIYTYCCTRFELIYAYTFL